MMRSYLVLWEAPSWNKMYWFEFQLLYLSTAPLLVLPLMSCKPAKKWRKQWAPSIPAQGCQVPGSQ